jgi:hypothetical protein
MKEIYSALDDLIDTFDRTNPLGSTKEKRKQSFAPVEYKIHHLRFIASVKAPYISEGISKLEQCYKAYFRISPTNGHNGQAWLNWAESAIRGIKRELGSFERSTSDQV